MTPQVLGQRVARGAAQLDGVRPGWEKQIDLEVLDIGSGLDCVWGQVFGSYTKGLHVLGLDDKEAERLGTTLTDPQYAMGESRWVALTQAWARQVRKRLALAA